MWGDRGVRHAQFSHAETRPVLHCRSYKHFRKQAHHVTPLDEATAAVSTAGRKLMGSRSSPRKIMLWRQTNATGSNFRSWSRRKRVEKAICPSNRARGAPKQ